MGLTGEHFLSLGIYDHVTLYVIFIPYVGTVINNRGEI